MAKNKLTLEQKSAKYYPIKRVEGGVSIKEIDDTERIVKAIGNTYFWIDSDQDMLVPGCATKSINERGPKSSADAKIKHQSDHVLKSTEAIGRLTVLDERKIDDRDVLYFESFIPGTRKGNDHLINYKEHIYDNHSIGFNYKQIIFACKDSMNESERRAWDEFYPLAINPEEADKFGCFYVVKEIELFEISVVSFGANQLTSNLSGKSKGGNSRLKIEIIERIDDLTTQLKSIADTKDSKKTIELESLQLKQIITDLELKEPSKKSTQSNGPDNKDTSNEGSKTSNLISNISKNL